MPIKLVFPLSMKNANYSMIGLGDIIIPGLFSSMCARIDLITSFKNFRAKAIKRGIKDDETL
jgi:hypothetical protein